MKSFSFVKKMFQDYYAKGFSSTGNIPSIEKREFGFASFEGRMLRHRSFLGEKELILFLQDLVPRDAYVSCAFYEYPEAEMDKKNWLGADLVFDIDADHIPTRCDKAHDEWTCSKCGFTGKGVTPEKCPICEGEKFNGITWPCEVCLASAKAETIKVLDILARDFGFTEKEMHAFFSGHRGYHVHVESGAAKNLDAAARKEIVDYVSGLGFDISSHGLIDTNRSISYGLGNLGLNDFGWRGRVAKNIYHFILDAKEENYRSLGLKKNTIGAMMRSRDTVLRSLSAAGHRNTIKGVGFETWRTIAEFCAKSEYANVDTVVTTDIHRLIRLTNTLHGKTGFRKVEFPISGIEDFDPFKSALAFNKGTVLVFVSSAPKFRVGDEIFGPYKNRRVELPSAAAVLLICKGVAEAVS